MRTTRVLGVVALLASAYPSTAAVEAISKASPPSETVEVFRGVGGLSSDDALPPTYVDVSSNGRFVLYRSAARNILAGIVDERGGDDLFLLDRVSRQTALVTHRPGSSEPFNLPAVGRLSEDASTVLFAFEGNDGYGPSGPLYLFDRTSGGTRYIGEGGGNWLGNASRPLSADGSWSAIVSRGPANELGRLFLYEKVPATLHPVPLPAGCVAQSPEISADGLTVLFELRCQGDDFGAHKVALYERASDAVTIVRTNAMKGALSRDGRFFLFGSRRSDVLPGLVDANGSYPDLYRYDRVTQETLLVNRGASPMTTWTGPGVDVYSARISDDGSVVALTMGLSPATEPFVFKAAAGTLQKATTQPGPNVLSNKGVALSGDGRTLAYVAWSHVFVVDVPTMESRSVTSTSFPGEAPNSGSFAPVLSRDGTLVVFASVASNLGVGIRDFDNRLEQGASLFGVELASDLVVPLSLAGNESRVQFLGEGLLLVSGDGERVAFAALSNASSTPDVALRDWVPIVRDRAAGVATRLGGPGRPVALSDDGSTTVVSSFRNTWIYTAYRDGVAQGSTPSFGSGPNARATVSADGRKVACVVEESGEAVFGRGVVSLWDVSSGQTRRISRSASTGGIPNDASGNPVISKDGRFIAFESLAGDLLPGASFPSGQRNVFLYDVVNDSVKLVSGTSPSVPADGATELGWGQVLSADGRYLVITTKASSLGGLPLPAGGSHVVLYDRTLDAYTLVSGPAPSGLPNADLPSLDGAGRFIVFRRSDPASVGTTSAGFVFDRQTGIAARFSDPSVRVSDVQISASGSTIAFTSPGATTADAQVFVVDRRTGRRTLASHGAVVGEPGNGVSQLAGLDGNGDLIPFWSSSTNLGVDLGFTSGGPRDPACCSSLHFAAFAFTVPPIAYTVSPACASTTGGRTVTIEGAHFRPGSTVTLDGIPATVTNVTSTAITVVTGARAPTSARTGNVEVRSPDGEYYALGNAFTYAVRGDANNSGALTAADGFYLNLALFLGGPQPASLCNGDANGSGATTSADAFFLNLYLFLGGAPPPP